MIAKIRAAGATDVIQLGASWSEADHHLREVVLAADANGIYIPPFDHPEIWNGSAGIVREMRDQLPSGQPDAIVCSVGGGGLFAGIMQGLSEEGWSGTNVLAVETEGAASLHASIDAGELVTLNSIDTIATSLGARRVAAKAFEYGMKDEVKTVVLSDAEAAMGCWRLADDERVLVESACGVSVAVCYDGRLKRFLPGLTKESRVVVVLCGGSNVSLEILAEYRNRYGYIEKIATSNKGVPSTLTAPRPVNSCGEELRT